VAKIRGYPVLPLGRADVDLMADGSGEKLRGWLKAGDTVVFVSAKAPCRDYVMFEQNIAMVKNALDGIVGQPLTQLLYISSDAVYSDLPTPLTEASVTASYNLHGQVHLARKTMFARSLGDVPYGTLRPTLIYGADDPHNGYGPNRFRRLVHSGEEITLFGNGEELRDHVSVLDVAELGVRMIEHRTVGALNAATGHVSSFLELAKMTIGFSGRAIDIQRLPRSAPMPHGGYRPFDPAEVVRLFPDFTFTDIEAGLRVAYEQTNPADL